MTLLAKSVDGKSVDSLFGLFKHMIQTHYADPGVWEQHGRLHARFWLYYHTNTHPYYHREGLWLSPQERARDGALHLCYAVGLLRALIDLTQRDNLASEAREGGGGGGGGGGNPRGSVFENRRQDEAQCTLLDRIEAARERADRVPIVREWREFVPEQAQVCYASSIPHNHHLVRRWSAARDIATALLLWCCSSLDTEKVAVLGRRRSHRSAAAPGQEQLLGGARRFLLIRKRPDGVKEAFAAVATEEEAAGLHPEYMQDQQFAMGASFSRIDDKYRSGEGGRVLGYKRATRSERKRWSRSAEETINAVIADGEAASCDGKWGTGTCPMDDWIEAARRRLVERSQWSTVDGATEEDLEAQIEEAQPSINGFIAPQVHSSKDQSRGCSCASAPKIIRPKFDGEQ